MYTNCDDIFKLTIPAVRIAVAKELSSKYEIDQASIAKGLGVAQPAVSKYLKSKYSGRIGRLEKAIEQRRLQAPIARMVAAKKDRAAVLQSIDRLASSAYLIKEALKIMHS